MKIRNHYTDAEQFVDREAATIGHEQEVVIEDDSNHRDLCLLSGNYESMVRTFQALYVALDATRSAIANEPPCM